MSFFIYIRKNVNAYKMNSIGRALKKKIDMDRVYNFSSGPAAINIEILKAVQKDMLNCMGSGMSILEMNHRSDFFGDLMAETSELFRELMEIDDSYEILYINGGGYMQFAMIPMNLMNEHKTAGFIDTDYWTQYAIEEAAKFGQTTLIASSKDKAYTYIPEIYKEKISNDLDYIYLCTNNTSSGTALRPHSIPIIKSVPIVADMTSNFLSESYDIDRFGLVFAAAQKNLGPTGVTVVIAKKELIEKADERVLPKIMCYKEYAKTNSSFSTPATFAIYMILLVLKWIKKRGGVSAISEMNLLKSNYIYEFIDNSQLFHSKIEKNDRSIMNIVFSTNDPKLDAHFICEAEKNGYYNLSGYKNVGGLRAGIYNGVDIEAVKSLVNFMKEFENQNKGEDHV